MKSVKCRVGCVEWEVGIVKCKVWSKNGDCGGVWNVEWELWSVKCGVWSVKFGVERGV